MMSTRFRFLAIIGLLVCGLLPWRSVSTAEVLRASSQRTKLVQTAIASLEQAQAAYNVGHATIEDVYQWSHRLMNAQLMVDPDSTTAASDHADRMRQLHEGVAQRHASGAEGGELLALRATEFYVAEAEAE